VRDFRLSGAELSDDQKERFAEIQEKQAALTTRFSENILDATNDFACSSKTKPTWPACRTTSSKLHARLPKKMGSRVSNSPCTSRPTSRSCNTRQPQPARKIYRANATKASELGAKPEWDNTTNMQEILKLRHEEAKLLGFKKLRRSVTGAEDGAIAARSHRASSKTWPPRASYAEKDWDELRAFAKDELGIDTIEAWDMTYAAEKLREQRYAFSEQEVKQYFPEPKVTEGLFQVIQRLFNVSIKPDSAPVWHPDVKFFRIERDGKLVGQFYLDLYARSGKRGGAWMDDARGRRMTGQRRAWRRRSPT
jgi:oligopeptidase A